MLEILMNEIMFAFSIIIQLNYDFFTTLLRLVFNFGNFRCL
jgi:hypothetical protein